MIRIFDDVSNYFITRRFMLLLALLNMIDAILTVFAVGHLGAIEINPLFSFLNNGSGFLLFIFIKLIVSFFLLYAISRLWNSWWMVNHFVRVLYTFGGALAFLIIVTIVVSNIFVILSYI